jgi:asparagine synthase (glutamine-hydrolysing)
MASVADPASGPAASDRSARVDTGFFCAVSNSPDALRCAAQRLSPSRRYALLRGTSRDGRLLVDLIGQPIAAAGHAAAWLAGRARVDPGDPGDWDGNFVLLRASDHGFRVQRDRLGAHPLYAVTCRESGAELLLLGSSPTELLRAAGQPAQVERDALQRFLAVGTVAGRSCTLFHGVQELARDCAWEVGGDGIAPRRVALAPLAPHPAADGGYAERVDALRDELRASAQLFDGPGAAVALSGGIDSSGLLATLTRVRGAAVDAFTFATGTGTDDDELPWARATARLAGARHHTVALDPIRIPTLMAQVAAQQPFPFGSPVVLAQAELFRHARSLGFDALLGGHGPDLLCGGADTHLSLRLARLLRGGRAVAALRMLPGAGRHSAAGARRLLLSAAKQALSGTSRVEADARADAWLSPDWRAGSAAAAGSLLPTAGPVTPLHDLIEAQLSRSAGASSLLYERHNALGAGIAAWQPYLVASLQRLSRACAEDELVSDRGQTKRILRDALQGLVPEANLQRQRRIGFAVPAAGWLSANRRWVDDRLGELRSLPAWAGPPAAVIWRALEAGGSPATATAFRLWRWISLLEWSRCHDLRYD